MLPGREVHDVQPGPGSAAPAGEVSERASVGAQRKLLHPAAKEAAVERSELARLPSRVQPESVQPGVAGSWPADGGHIGHAVPGRGRLEDRLGPGYGYSGNPQPGGSFQNIKMSAIRG